MGAALLAKKHGWQVLLSDSGALAGNYKEKLTAAGIEFEEGGHTESRITAAELVVKSPGIPDTAPAVKALRARGISIISEIEFAGLYTRGRTVCVTGSNGKTTTATLIYRMLSRAGFDVGLAGNIGDSFALQVAEGDREWYVLELSSFQLDGMERFKADVAVLTNITPDHLDRYGNDMQLYADSKFRITQNQTYSDYFIYSEDDAVTVSQLPRYDLPMRMLPYSTEHSDRVVRIPGRHHGPWEGADLEGGSIVAEVDGRRFAFDPRQLKILGKHNVRNAMAAILAAMAAGVDGEAIDGALQNFEGIEHRMEPAGEIDGVLYINDSKATNTDSVWYALESMERPVVWIAGGTDKGNDYSSLEDLVRRKVKALVIMGKDTRKLKDYFSGIVPVVYDTDNLDDAMSLAAQSASRGDVVLLSPACASFDLFKNYEDRGRQFKQWVREHTK